MIRGHILVCNGKNCRRNESKDLIAAFEKELQARELDQEIKVAVMGCQGLCEEGPIMIVYPEGTTYAGLKVSDVPVIVTEHLIKGKVVRQLEYKEFEPAETILSIRQLPFYQKQRRVALRNCGIINPESIDEYVAMNGYQALGKVLTEMTPTEVVDVVKRSGLRGRGGGGFPTGTKWEFAAASVSDKKYVCCNADEGDPGAFMDRAVLEGDPHALVEAMAIAGYAIGADEGYIYIRAEYPLAVQRIEKALAQARDYGMLGENIFGTDFNFEIDIRLGAGAFVCGEETALMTSIEGNRGEPRPRPPFPAIKGLFGKPTMLNNVETFVNIPQIILRGADWFSAMGTEKSKGTKVFALGGKITNTGLVEIPMGMPLREIIEDIGGGVPGGKRFKAAQSGGPSGGCIPAALIDTPIDYDNLIELGSMMGSGGLIVIDEDNCMVDIAKFFLEFTVDESCGKCTPCRIGTRRLLEMLEQIISGRGTMETLDKLEDLCLHIKSASLCGLGQTAPNPVLSTLRHFRGEYEAHVREGRCPAGVCRDLLVYFIDSSLCKGCNSCVKVCPVNAIAGSLENKHSIDFNRCIRCGSCLTQCPFGAIKKK